MEAPSDRTCLHEKPRWGELREQAAWRRACLAYLAPTEGRETQQLSPVDEGLWRELMTPHREYWAARSEEADLTPSQHAYALARARSLDRTYESRGAGCERGGRVMACGCGPRAVMFGCRKHLTCERCRKKRARKTVARIRNALDGMLRTSPGQRVIMATLTIAHSGDVDVDRRKLVEGWKRFRKAYRRRWGKFAFIGVHEVTTGRDALGHMHAHVLCVWPWRDWGELSALWRAACPQSSRINFQALRNPRAGAEYVGKYVSKGVDTSDFTPELRARVLAATYGARWLFTSRGVWIPFVPVCPCCMQPVVADIVNRWLRTEAPRHADDAYPDWWDPVSYRLALETLPKTY